MSKRRPSPAMIVAVIALTLGLGGAAIAADLSKPQVKKIAKKVANKQIKKKAILKKQEGNLRVAHARTADNATTATNAANAAAVNGLSVTKIDYGSSTAGPVVVFNHAGLTITADCAGGNVSLTATTSKQDSSILASVVDTDDATTQTDHSENGNFDVGDSLDLLAGDEGNPALITFDYFAPDGSTVTGILATDEGGPGGCEANGTITSG